MHMNDARAIATSSSEDGEKTFFVTASPFTGPSGGDAFFTSTPFEASRTSAGWRTSELLPSSSEYTYGGLGFLSDISADTTSRSLIRLDSPFLGTLVSARETDGYFIQEPANSESLAPAQGPGGEMSIIPQSGPFADKIAGNGGNGYLGGSADLSHLFFADPIVGENIVEAFEVDGTWRDRFVAVTGSSDPDVEGNLLSDCGVNLGAAGHTAGSLDSDTHTTFHAVSEDGSIVFFTAEAKPFFAMCNGPGADEIFARINGTQTIPISEPSEGFCPPINLASGPPNFGRNPLCANALFQGASKDGSRVFFTTTQSETPGVTDATTNLYEADIDATGSAVGVRAMSQLSAGDPNNEARVQGVTRISDDGSHIYFVAQGQLTNDPNAQGQKAQSGADNLYVAVNGKVAFIGALCSGMDTSGTVADQYCPSAAGDQALWDNGEGGRRAGGSTDYDNHPAWAAPFGAATDDGRFLVFDTYAQLITTGAGADTDTAADVYEYDSQTGNIIRISAGRDGFDRNGNDSAYDATIPSPTYEASGANANPLIKAPGEGRPVSNDGQYVFFTTSEALQSEDVNAAPDVYEWHNGLVAMISDGQDTSTNLDIIDGGANRFVSASASGRDVFFQSPDVLVPDGGASTDAIWDARIGGGFPVAGIPSPCREDACQGSIAATPSFPTPTSAVYSSDGNLPPVVVHTGKPKPKSKSKKLKPRKRPVVRKQGGKRGKSLHNSSARGRK